MTVLVTPSPTVYPLYTSQNYYPAITPVSINPSGDRVWQVASAIASLDADLQVFRTHIDEKNALGFDTSAAEVKYNEARQKLDSARSRPVSQYTEALRDLNAVVVAIREGEIALANAAKHG